VTGNTSQVLLTAGDACVLPSPTVPMTSCAL
jgi:hypothetical protein